MRYQKQLVEDLWSLRFVLTPKSNWTQRVNARNKLGIGVEANDPSATCFCLQGAAINVCSDDLQFKRLWQAIQRSCALPLTLNDSVNTKHRDVLDLIDETILRESAS